MDEARRMDDHPGIVFRPGPSGRRAALPGGPDMWEVIGTLNTVGQAEPALTDDALVEATAEALGRPASTVRTAVRYYAAYRDEIDERITANAAATEAAEALSRAERDVLGGGRAAS